MTRPVATYHVRPRLPERLAALEPIAFNLRWAWDHETIALFRRLDRDLWEVTNHNPVAMLGALQQERLREAAEDEAFIAHMERVKRSLDEYVAGVGTWYRKAYGVPDRPLVAYFSMEFGVTECLPIYSGGLGILAGDHLKSASDLGLPLVGVGLLYQKGYFRQYLNPDGWQQERYPVNDLPHLPIRPILDASGSQRRIQIELADREAVARLFLVQVGRVPLILLDSNVPENPQDLQDVTDELYGGDAENRIRQEILLGVGGVRALEACGYHPRVYHMNEGHCAFQSLERIRRRIAHGLRFEEALEAVRASSVFTTHTPVPAGIDVFAADLLDRYFHACREQCGVTRERFLGLGRVRPGDEDEPFNMAVLALRTSSYANGVSRLHGRVSRAMWRDVWPGAPVDELPIAHVTNGIHPGSWISEDMRNLYDRYLGPRWLEEPGDTRIWLRGTDVPGEELWRTHERRRERMVGFARRHLAEQRRKRGAGPAEIAQAQEALDPEALTIGFARRFAAYKRATLLLSDPERLARILNAKGRPVQIVYAGKAHPRDEKGKALIRQIVQLSRQSEFRRRIVFLEDYDAVIARYLVQGTDVWLNTPRRPLEASGTSGMKAAFNGALNLSVLDGWWDEGWRIGTGWAIGRGEEYGDEAEQDRLESMTLYDLLEREVVPLFYRRGPDGLPHDWIDMMKSAMAALCPAFNTNRMVHEYTLHAYKPAEERRGRLEADDFRGARELAAWRRRVERAWHGVRITRIERNLPDEVQVGGAFEPCAWVHLNGLQPREVAVDAYAGRLDEAGEIVAGLSLPMSPTGRTGADGVEYRGVVPWTTSGLHGFTIRVLPRHDELAHPLESGLIHWAV